MGVILAAVSCWVLLATASFRPLDGAGDWLSEAETLALPPLPEGVAHVSFSDFFRKPVGPRGLEYTERIRDLDGKKVRILGHMVRQGEPHPGFFLLAPLRVTLHEHEYGLCDDLPGSTLHVFLPPGEETATAPWTPRLLLLTGTLRLGTREEADGRISAVRLELDPANRPLPARAEDE